MFILRSLSKRRWCALIALLVGLAAGESRAQPDLGGLGGAISVDQLSKGLQAGARLGASKEQFNAEIARARKEYWSRFPDGEGVEEAKAKYYGLLAQKDFYYMVPCLVAGVEDGEGTMAAMDALSGLRKFDGGIRPDARFPFERLVAKIRTSAGLHASPGSPCPHRQLLIIPSSRAAEAIKASSGAMAAYLEARDRAECKAAFGHIKFASARDWFVLRLSLEYNDGSTERSGKLYDDYARVLGEPLTELGADAMRRVPADANGELMFQEKIVFSSMDGPADKFIRIFVRLLERQARAKDLPERALLTVNAPLTQYELAPLAELCRRHGRDRVLAVAAKIAAAPATGEGNRYVADYAPGSRMYTRPQWFQRLLEDPKLTLPTVTRPPVLGIGDVETIRDAAEVGTQVTLRAKVARIVQVKYKNSRTRQVEFHLEGFDPSGVFVSSPNLALKDRVPVGKVVEFTGRVIPAPPSVTETGLPVMLVIDSVDDFKVIAE